MAQKSDNQRTRTRVWIYLFIYVYHRIQLSGTQLAALVVVTWVRGTGGKEGYGEYKGICRRLQDTCTHFPPLPILLLFPLHTNKRTSDRAPCATHSYLYAYPYLPVKMPCFFLQLTIKTVGWGETNTRKWWGSDDCLYKKYPCASRWLTGWVIGWMVQVMARFMARSWIQWGVHKTKQNSYWCCC